MASIKVTLLGHASMLFEPDTGEKIYLDPWLEGSPVATLAVDDIKEADIVVATHGHNDHIGDSYAICRNTGATFVSNYELCVVAEQNGLTLGENAVPFNPGGTATVGDIRITATQAFHSLSVSPNLSKGAAPENGYFHPDGGVCGIVLQFANGITVYDTSDTSLFSDMQLISQMYGPQIAVLPVGGKFTMGVREGARAASFIRPDIVIPNHYGEPQGQPADIEALKDAVALLSPNTDVVALGPNGAVTYETSSYTIG
ncbi:TPA: metal-dependent hydrolase [Candidatus Latescibacteria bacterium]|nr:metal-dependent hydrolase [Candidatus Latescibacterota bacterium]